MSYAAFMSYSHAADSRFTPWLQAALQRFARPWYGFGGLRIYRDETSLAVTPSLWDSLQQAMADSEYFILIASPEAAQSSSVAQEVGYWLEHKSAGTLLIVLTGGSAVWDRAAGDLDWTRTNALPPNLRHAFRTEPFFLDLSSFAHGGQVPLKDPDFRLAAARLAAKIRNCTVEEIESEDVRQRGRFRRYVALGIFALLILSIGVWYYAWRAGRNRRMAEDQRIISIAQDLATQAGQERREAGDHERAALFARQAWLFMNERRGLHTADVDAALRRVVEPAYFAVRLGPAEGELNLLAASPDSRWIAGTGPGAAVWLFDLLRRGSPPHRLSPAPLPLRTLGFTGDSQRLYGLSEDDKVIVWDLSREAAEPRATPLHGAEGLLGAAAFSPSARRLASARADGAVLVWNVAALNAPPRVLCCHPGGVGALAFEPKREETLAVGGGGQLRIWTLDRPAGPLAVSPPLPAAIAALQYGCDGRLVTAATMPVMRAAFPDLLREMLTGTATDSGTDMKPAAVFVWSPEHPAAPPRRLGEQDGNIAAVTFTGGGQVAALSTKARTIPLWRASGTPAKTAELRSEYSLTGLVATNNADFMASIETVGAPGGPRSFLRVWRMQPAPAAPIIARIYHELDPVSALAFTGAGDSIASAAGRASTIWNPRSGAVTALDHGDANAVAIAFSPNGEWLASGSESLIGSGHDFSLRLWRASSLKEPYRHYDDHASRVGAVAFSPDGQWIASAGRADGVIRVRKVGAGLTDAVTQVRVSGEVHSIAFRSATQLAWGSSDGNISFQDISRPAASPARVSAHEGCVRSLAFGRGGRLLLSGGDDGRVLVWHFERDQPVRAERGRVPGIIYAVAADREGTLAASGGRDGIVRLWDLERSTAQPARLGSGATVYSLAFSPDGTRIAAGRNDGEIDVWARTSLLADSVCQLVWRNLTRAEWKQFIGTGYRRTCPDLPEGP